MIVREAKIGDAARIAEIHTESLKYVSEQTQIPSESVSLEERRVRATQSIQKGSDFFVCEHQDIVMGFLCAGAARDEFEYEYELYAIYVHPSQFRHGIGKALFNHLFETLKIRSVKTLYLWVWETNMRAIDFYKALGAKVGSDYRTLEEGNFKTVCYWDKI